MVESPGNPRKGEFLEQWHRILSWENDVFWVFFALLQSKSHISHNEMV